MSKVGRNDPCPCGSGKKYKKCHLGHDGDIIPLVPLASWRIQGCYTNDDFDETGLATVLIVRENPDNDKLSIASFLCDMFCLGIKDCLLEMSTSEMRLSFLLTAQPQEFVATTYQSARNLVLGSASYAAGLGFEPYYQYQKASAMIEADKPYDTHAFEYGREGRPFYYTGPNDDYAKIFGTLELSCGKGNFDYEIDERVDYVYEA